MSAGRGTAAPETTWAVVPTRGGGEELIEGLRSLVGAGLAPERIVLVDNASTDGTPARAAAELPGLHVLRNATNRGYGHATNQGLALALDGGAQAVLLANDDVTFPPGALPPLLEALNENAVGIVGPRVVYKDEPGRIWCAGGVMTWRQNLTRMLGHREQDGPRFQRTLDVDYVPGCAMLVRRGVFEQIGLLEGDYFAYHEDVEFCLKARDAGHRVRMIGAAHALHAAHSSTGGGYNPTRKYMMGVNTVWFLRRHGTPLRWLSFLFFDVLSLPFTWLLRAPRGEGPAVLAKARGMLAGLRGQRVTEEALQDAG